MTQPMNRDEFARHLYIHFHDEDGGGAVMQRCGATEWDQGMVTGEDRDDCYAQADRQLAEEAIR